MTYEIKRFPHDGGVDADGHVLEPADLWEQYLPDRYKDRALRIGVDDDFPKRLFAAAAPIDRALHPPPPNAAEPKRRRTARHELPAPRLLRRVVVHGRQALPLPRLFRLPGRIRFSTSLAELEMVFGETEDVRLDPAEVAPALVQMGRTDAVRGNPGRRSLCSGSKCKNTSISTCLHACGKTM